MKIIKNIVSVYAVVCAFLALFVPEIFGIPEAMPLLKFLVAFVFVSIASLAIIFHDRRFLFMGAMVIFGFLSFFGLIGLFLPYTQSSMVIFLINALFSLIHTTFFIVFFLSRKEI